MSTFDYESMQVTVAALLLKFGREIVLKAKERSPADSDQPWDGPSGGAPDASTTVNAVFVPPNTVRQFGLTALGTGTEFIDQLKFSESVIIGFAGDGVDIRIYNKVVDDAQDWGILASQVLKPGDNEMLFYLAVRR